MAEGLGDERPGGGMVAAFDVFEDCCALLLLDAALEDSSDATLNKFSIYYCVCSGSALN